MQTANHFACGIRPWDNMVLGVKHFSVAVDGYAAHGVVDTWCNLDCMERPFVNRCAQCGGTAKILIVLLLNKAVVALKRGEKRVVIDTKLLCQFTRGAGAGDQATGDVLICGFVFCANMFVKHNVSVLFRQRDNRR